MKIIKIFYDKKALLQSIFSKSMKILLATTSGAVITVTFDLTFGTEISSLVGQSGLGSLVLAALMASAFAAILSGLPLLVHAIASSGGETDWAESSNIEPTGALLKLVKGFFVGAAYLFASMLQAATKGSVSSGDDSDSGWGVALCEEDKVMGNIKPDIDGNVEHDPFYQHHRS